MDWQPIGTEPQDGTPFEAAERIKKARTRGGVTLRRSQKFIANAYEQRVGNQWVPAIIRPNFWKPLAS